MDMPPDRTPQPERLLAWLAEVPPAPADDAAMLAAMTRLQAEYPALDLPPRAPAPGWVPLIEVVCKMIAEEIPAEALAGWRTTDMAEKYAGLRWSWQAPAVSAAQAQWLADLIDQDLDAASMLICQVCGKPGQVRAGSWDLTLCDRHAAAQGRR